MKTKNLLIEYGHLPLHELPQDIRQQVESNPEALQYFQQSAWINSALTIKQFETADEATLGRITYNVETQIANLRPEDFEQADSSTAERPWFIRMTPGLLFGATGVLAGMLFLHTLDGMNSTPNTLPINQAGMNPVVSTVPTVGVGLRNIPTGPATLVPTNDTQRVRSSVPSQ